MKRTVFVILTLILTLLQVTFSYHLCFGLYNYGLMLTAVIVLTTFDHVSGYISAFVCGFFMDCLLGGSNLMYMIVCAATVAVVHISIRKAFRQSFLTVLFFVFVLTFASELIQYWFFIAGRQSGTVAYALTELIFPQAFINAFCVLFMYPLYAWIFKKLNFEKGGWRH